MSFISRGTLKLNIFGSSHGELVGCTVEGLPAGLELDRVSMAKWLGRRRPAQSIITTQRKEQDEPSIVAGTVDGFTDGSPLTIMIRNRDQISSHYDELKYKPRPGHGDLTLYYKYGEHRNYSGGGFLSGRMTAPLVAAGSVALGLLEKYGIEVVSYMESIGSTGITDRYSGGAESVYDYITRIPDAGKDREAESLLLSLMKSGDSTGGIIRTLVRNHPAGLGEPFFDSVESAISSAMFSIPGLKGIEFGTGFGLATMKGSEANDAYFYDNGSIRTRSNNNGGILGGMTNGMPVDFRVVMKPTSSIRIESETVNLETGRDDRLTVKGRHDPCIAIRAVPVVQSMAAIIMLDFMIQAQKIPRVLD